MKNTILVVEDEKEVSEAITSILEDEGYHVLVSSDGLEAQKVLKDKTPALILSDIMMPHCDGYSLLNFVKSNRDLRKIPFVLMSAAQMKKVEVMPDKFIRKPFNLEQLLDTVAAYMRSKSP